MKIAIHKSKTGFPPRWIEYCKEKGIEYKEVCSYDNDIIEQVKDCDAYMWHHNHMSYKDVLFAKQLLYSLEKSGKKVFPNFNTTWHFDDKVGQKYLFESLGVPFVKTYVFYTKKEALNWVNETTFPKVFKLRGGAGSSNVKLARTSSEAKKYVRKAFGKGFPQYDKIASLKERYRKYKLGKSNFLDLLKGIGRFFIPLEFAKMIGSEKGYVYFQDFLPNNDFDIRVIIIDKKAFAIKRVVRENDFRASGSGSILYDKKEFDDETIRLAFSVAAKMNSQSVALDFVFDEQNNPLVVEVSYGFVPECYEECVGYWSEDMIWHEGEFNPYAWMVENLIR